MFLKQSYPPDKKSVSSLTKQPIQEEIKYPRLVKQKPEIRAIEGAPTRGLVYFLNCLKSYTSSAYFNMGSLI